MKLTLRARILPLALISTRTGSNTWRGEMTETIYEPLGIPKSIERFQVVFLLLIDRKKNLPQITNVPSTCGIPT